MKATTVFVFALTAAAVCAQPAVMPREYYYAGVPRAVADLEARGWHVNWHKVGNFAKDAAKIGADILFKRMDVDELYARGFVKEDLVTRDFDGDYLEARGWPHINWHNVGNFAKGAAKIGADILFKRMNEDELHARGFIYKEDLVTRDFDSDYLEARRWPHINWHNVGNFAKGAAKIGADILFKRMDEDELYARGFNNEDLVARDFDDDGDRPPVHHRHPHNPPRSSRHDANHKKVGKYGKSWAAKGTAHRGYAARRPSRPAVNLDDLN